jgi:D-xylose 1-dehydrogenase (NADP+, D-xylono-1,5-lactone-forming)
MKNKIRYGLISTAQIGRNAHVPAAKKAVNSEIVAVSSRDLQRAEYWAKQLEIGRVFGSYQEMLDDPEIDAVINTLPNSMHHEWTIRAAEAGKHILCEKPLAVNVREAQEMAAAARANNVLLMEAFTIRFVPQMPFVRQQLSAGVIGAVKIVRSELTFTIQDWVNDVRAKADLTGGALMDAGCYCVNAIRYLMEDEPMQVSAYQRVRQPNGVDSTTIGIMQFPGERLAYMATGMEQPFRGCCEIIGSHGRIEIPDLFGGSLVKIVKNGGEQVHKFDKFDRFQAQIEHFSDCILKGTPQLMPPEDAVKNTAVLVALQASADQGKTVEVEQIG